MLQNSDCANTTGRIVSIVTVKLTMQCTMYEAQPTQMRWKISVKRKLPSHKQLPPALPLLRCCSANANWAAMVVEFHSPWTRRRCAPAVCSCCSCLSSMDTFPVMNVLNAAPPVVSMLENDDEHCYCWACHLPRLASDGQWNLHGKCWQAS